MAEERKDSDIQKTWFGNTLKQEEEARTGGLQPSMEGKGYEQIRIERDDVLGDRERGGHPGFETMKINEVPMFLLDSLRNAANRGHLPRTYAHLTEQLFKAGGIDEKVYKALKKFNGEVEKATHWTEQVKLFKESIEPYIGKISMQKV